MKRCALMLVLVLASTAGAEELAPRTRALLHEALEARLTLPTEPPSLQRPVLPPSLPAPAAAAARESTTAATRAGQNAAANRAAQDVANGRGRPSDPSESARNAAGQARAAEARATGGNGATHGNPNGPPPGKGGGKP
ncbi:MAG: hypothetical protein EHM78_05090 [Myxococcaceae bacterium]|jgi:hypothetical protein|nr:MAG: hypothetical protein EHM78_05090 [Myxococcaceae bacterium]